MKRDKIWLISATVCLLASATLLVGSLTGMSDEHLRIAGAVNLAALVTATYRTMKNRMY